MGTAAATSSGTFTGIGARFSAGTTAYSAIVPSAVTPPGPAKNMTRVPGAQRPAGSAATTPAPSLPSVIGPRWWRAPVATVWSRGVTPAAVTWTRTSPGPGVGSA